MISVLNTQGEPRLFHVRYDRDRDPAHAGTGRPWEQTSPPMSAREVQEWVTYRRLLRYVPELPQVLGHLALAPGGAKLRFEPARQPDGAADPKAWTWLEVERRWLDDERLARALHRWQLGHGYEDC